MTRPELQLLIKKYGNHFAVDDFGSDISGLDAGFIESALKFRKWHGFPSLITSAYRVGDDGAHGRGLALDQIIFQKGKFLKETLDVEHYWNLLHLWPFAGAGIYFDWNITGADGKKTQAIGIHIDNLVDPKKRPLRWLRIAGHYYYLDPVTNHFHAKTKKSPITLADAIAKYVVR